MPAMSIWTLDMIRFLKKNYHVKGDKEIAEIFEKKFPKNIKWTIKHIEKKRGYLGLKRTELDLEKIKIKKFNGMGDRRYRLFQEEPSCQGEIKFRLVDRYRIEPMIKLNGRFINWARWAWRKKHGEPPQGYVIVFKDNNPTNVKIENLELIGRSELTRRNQIKAGRLLSDRFVAHTMAYRDSALKKELLKHPEILKVKRQNLFLKREIKIARNDSKANSGKA